MTFKWLRSRDVCCWTEAHVRAVIEVPRYSFGLGFEVQRWGLRLLLGWWHLCIRPETG